MCLVKLKHFMQHILEMGIHIELCLSPAPVIHLSPVVDDILQSFRVHAIGEFGVFKWWCQSQRLSQTSLQVFYILQ